MIEYSYPKYIFANSPRVVRQVEQTTLSLREWAKAGAPDLDARRSIVNNDYIRSDTVTVAVVVASSALKPSDKLDGIVTKGYSRRSLNALGLCS